MRVVLNFQFVSLPEANKDIFNIKVFIETAPQEQTFTVKTSFTIANSRYKLNTFFFSQGSSIFLFLFFITFRIFN